MILMDTQMNLHLYGRMHRPHGPPIRVWQTTIATTWMQMDTSLTTLSLRMGMSRSSFLIPEGATDRDLEGCIILCD